MSRLLLANGRLIDPTQQLDRSGNLLIEDGRIASLDPDVGALANDPDCRRIDVAGKMVVPGLIDTCAEFCEPGFEEDETIETGTAAALAGGFTSVACLPSTDPPVDSQASVEFIQHQAARADNCHVFVLACVSKNRAGEELSEMGSLVAAGAVGFTDANRPVFNAELMRRALQYSQMFDRPILNHPEVPDLNTEGVMHEGLVSTLLGLSPMPAEAEDVMTGRDIRLADATGGRLHLLHVSSAGSVDLLRRSKSRGVPVTAGINAVNFAMTDDALRSFDANCKLNPPLRSADHVEQCIAALIDGTIDVICSGHSPRAAEKKMEVLHTAPFGMAALETTLGLVVTKLIEPGHLSWSGAIEKLSCNPARILGLVDKGSLRPGADADITVIDPHASTTVEPAKFRSKSSNTPLTGWELKGRVELVFVAGRERFRFGG